MPNASPNAESQDSIDRAIFEQFYAFIEDDAPAVLIRDEKVEWRGRQGQTYVMSSAEAAGLQEAIGLDGIGYIRIQPPIIDEERNVPPRDGDRVLELSIYRGGLNAVGFRVVMRRIADRWLMVSCRMSWIS